LADFPALEDLMSNRKEHHVVPHKDGWAVKRENSERASSVQKTKGDAVRIGREISKNQGTEFIIHKKDGTIQESDSHGNDPRSSKG
jgi:uncharacterized protein YdaT